MAGTAAAAGVSVEILVKRNQVAPVRIFIEELVGAKESAIAVLIPQKNMGQALSELVSDLGERL